jgi:hypothetical protein
VSYLQNISALVGADNTGGIYELQVARARDIDHIPAPVAGTIYGDIIFKAGYGWHTWAFSHQTAGANSETKISREGSSKTNRLRLRIPKGRASIQAMLDRASEDEFIILYRENGKQKIFGTLQAPVQFSYSHNTGDQVADLNHYECQFFADAPGNIFEYNGSVASAPAGPAPALVKYNGGTIAVLAPGETFNIISDFGFTDFYISTS